MSDGRRRCPWGQSTPEYQRYHDEEWGRPVTDDRGIYERLVLEGFQSGLSWLTILRKRENFRAAFDGFDIERVAAYATKDVERLLADAGIVRHRGKIESAINNAQRAIELIDAAGSINAHVRSFAPDTPHRVDSPTGIPPLSPASTALSKDLKKRGWSFVGPTTIYAFMQSMGVVNDHMDGCFARAECEGV